MFDTHMHSKNSHDGRQTLDEICLSAIEKGVTGVTVTDHADINFYETRNIYESIKNSIADIRMAQEKYGDKLQIFCGIELGEYLFDPEKAKTVLSLTDFDQIIGSVHFIEKARWDRSYTKIVFDETVSDDEIRNYLKLYFETVSEMIDKFDFDILAHLTCPMRYINGRYKRNFDFMIFREEIIEILKKIIKKNIALEINTAGLSSAFGNELTPTPEIIKIYKDLGGKLLTIGSDAHGSEGIGKNFETVKEILIEIGSTHYYYYKNRKPIAVKL